MQNTRVTFRLISCLRVCYIEEGIQIKTKYSCFPETEHLTGTGVGNVSDAPLYQWPGNPHRPYKNAKNLMWGM